MCLGFHSAKKTNYECSPKLEKETSQELTRVLKNYYQGQAAVCVPPIILSGRRPCLLSRRPTSPSTQCLTLGGSPSSTWADPSLLVGSVTAHTLMSEASRQKKKKKACFSLYKMKISQLRMGLAEFKSDMKEKMNLVF